MTALRKFRDRLADAGWAIVSWADGTVAGRRALAQERLRSELLADRLSEQLRLNAQLIRGQDAGGGAE